MSYSEKDLVDAFKMASKSFTNVANKPGIFYASGIKYQVTTSGKLLTMHYIDKNGIETKIDINNPKTDKYYTTVLNDYCALGNDGFKNLNQPERTLEKYPFDATKCVISVMSKLKDPVELYDDGRIQIIPD